MLGAVGFVRIDIPRITMGTVPRTVPMVVSRANLNGILEANPTPISHPVCSANPTGTWRRIPQPKSGPTCRLMRTVISTPILNAIASVIAKVVCEPVCQSTDKARPEASFRAPKR
jgi:hypothetical protein